MPRYGFSITKSFTFRGAAQEHGNTYYYQFDTTLTPTLAETLLDGLVAKEKAIFATSVTFVRGKVWSAGGTKAENQMIFQKNLSGVGTQTADTLGLDRERAVLVRFRAGNDTRGNPVYLRKWWHLDVGALFSENITTGQRQNTAQLSSTQRGVIETEGNKFKTLVTAGANGILVSEKGRNIDGATQAHPYLEHHQLGEMWR